VSAAEAAERYLSRLGGASAPEPEPPLLPALCMSLPLVSCMAAVMLQVAVMQEKAKRLRLAIVSYHTPKNAGWVAGSLHAHTCSLLLLCMHVQCRRMAKHINVVAERRREQVR
jgi:uncharacterized membrane protein